MKTLTNNIAAPRLANKMLVSGKTTKMFGGNTVHNVWFGAAKNQFQRPELSRKNIVISF